MKILLDGHKDFEKKFKFKFSEPEIRIHDNGFISVRLDWVRKRTCDDFYKFKYANLAHRSYGGSFVVKRKKYFPIVSASFEFEDANEDCKNLNITPWFNISIASETEEGSLGEDFDYIFFENLKYGLICWFAPKYWENWGKAKPFKN